MGQGGTYFYFRPWYDRSPYFEATRRAGCKSYELYNNMYLPGYYTSFEDEYWHLVNHVALWDVAVERCVEITGPDAHRFTNALTCRDLNRCAVGQAKYAPIMADDGGIVNDPVLLRLGENHYWLALADSDALLYARGVATFGDYDVRIGVADSWPVQVQGPKSRDVMRALSSGIGSKGSATTGRSTRTSTGSPWSSRAPGGPLSSGSRFTSASTTAVRTCGTASSRPERRSRFGPPDPPTSAGWRPGSTTGGPTSTCPATRSR